MCHLAPEVWTAIFAGIGTLAVVIATFLAIPELKEMSRTGRLESTLAFIARIRSGRDAREFVYQSLPADVEGIACMTPEMRKEAEDAVNSLNEVGLLLEGKMIDRQLFLGLCHSMMIRCWYKLKPFAQYQEGRIGGRYARRIARLDRRAKLYHDIHPQHRTTSIRLATGGKSIVIYQTVTRTGLASLGQKLVWFVRRKLKWY